MTFFSDEDITVLSLYSFDIWLPIIFIAQSVLLPFAINIFYKQIILQKGIPFEIKLSSTTPIDMSVLSENELNAELEKGYADMKAGRTKPASKTFADIRKDYNL
jgi:antitoxin component of RelBE/YafQ-DinJ toxin-antitoxin module